MMMRTFRCLRLSVLVASLLAVGLGACGRTWEGLKALEKAGEDIKKQTQ
jgi:predicted small secreted protein